MQSTKTIPLKLNELEKSVAKGAAFTGMNQQAFLRECVRVGTPLLIQAFRDLRAKRPNPITRVIE